MKRRRKGDAAEARRALMRAVNRNFEVVDYEQLLLEQQMLLQREQEEKE